jgi:hypothetical protein
VNYSNSQRAGVILYLAASLFGGYYYYTLFEKNFDINMMRQGIKELLRDAEYLESLQYTVDSSFRVAKRFQKVIDKYKEIIDVRKNKSAGV